MSLQMQYKGEEGSLRSDAIAAPSAIRKFLLLGLQVSPVQGLVAKYFSGAFGLWRANFIP